MSAATGTCLCGKSKVEIRNYPTDAKSHIRCHCKDCALTSGSAFSTNILIKEVDVQFGGPVKTFDSKAASGNTVTRFFCGNCGCALAHNTPAFGDAMAIQTGPFIDIYQKIDFGTELFAQGKWAGVAVPQSHL
ncbi:hypothetical protein JCM11251_003589 [Rhodosporidiobolus azoricus]